MLDSYKLLRNFAFLAGLLFASAVAMAEEQNKCEKYDKYSMVTCNEAAVQLDRATTQIGAIHGLANEQGMNGGARTQSSMLRSEITAFTIAFGSCRTATDSCREACQQDSKACKYAEAKAIELATGEVQLQDALAKTEVLELATESTQSSSREIASEDEIQMAQADINVMAMAKNPKTGHVTQKIVLVPGSAPSVSQHLRKLEGQGLPAGYTFTGQTQ